MADKHTIARFQIAMALETEHLHLNPYLVDLGVEAVFNDPSKGRYYVASLINDPEHIIASLLTTYEWSDWRNGQVLWIQSVFVEPGFRRSGVFRSMYLHIKNLILDDKNEYRGIRLYVDKSNTIAQKVYLSLGMQNHHYETFEWMKS